MYTVCIAVGLWPFSSWTRKVVYRISLELNMFQARQKFWANCSTWPTEFLETSLLTPPTTRAGPHNYALSPEDQVKPHQGCSNSLPKTAFGLSVSRWNPSYLVFSSICFSQCWTNLELYALKKVQRTWSHNSWADSADHFEFTYCKTYLVSLSQSFSHKGVWSLNN